MKIIQEFKNLTWRKKSTIFYVIALFTPMFFGAWGLIGIFGISLGWIGVLSFEPSIGLPWIANIIYFILLIFKKMNTRITLILAIIMIIFSLFAIGITTVPRDEGGGNYDVIVGIGFGLWFLSFVFMLMEQISRLSDKTLDNNVHN